MVSVCQRTTRWSLALAHRCTAAALDLEAEQRDRTAGVGNNFHALTPDSPCSSVAATASIGLGDLTLMEHGDLPSLITAIENMKPRVILLNMATRDNTMLLRRPLKLSPTVRVIVLDMSEDDESEIVACAEAGVAGYHLRTESLGDLLVLIREVAAGESFCSPRVSAILLRRLSALASQRQPAAGKELVLTTREAQILKMLELGLSNRDIADQLCIALHTVKTMCIAC